MSKFNIEVHHAGKFIRDPEMRYENGKVKLIHDLDSDLWSYFEAVDIVKKLWIF